MNWDWDKNLPDAFRKKPEKIISKTYTDISQEEVYLHLMKGAVKPSNDPNIPL